MKPECPRLAYILVAASLASAVLLGERSLAPPIALAQQPDYFLGRDGTPVTVTRGNSPVDHTCNAHVFAQVPGLPDFFLGRARDYSPTGSGHACEPPHPGRVVNWLALYKMDWETHTISYVHDVLKPPMQIEGSEHRSVLLINAYDPSVIRYNGELWVAFECGGPGFRGTSTCIASLDPSTLTINDPHRVTVLVEGGLAADGYVYAGAVPNLFAFHDRVYVYWSALQIDRSTKEWLRIVMRGMALVQEQSGLRRFWGVGSVGRPVLSFDPSLNVEVGGLDSTDPMSDQCLDVKGIHATPSDIYVTASLGGRGPERKQNCTRPNGGSYGCFRLQIFHSSVPLGTDIFTKQPLIAPKLPLNPKVYERLFTDNHGDLSIIGYFFPPHPNYSNPYLVPPGMRSFRVNLAALKF